MDLVQPSSTSNRTTIPAFTLAPTINEKYSWISDLIFSVCMLSVLGSSMIILTYWGFRSTRSPSRRLLVYLSLTDLVTALSNGVGVMVNFQYTSIGCQAQAAVATFSSMSSYFWTVFLAVYLYLWIVHDKQELAQKLVVWFHVMAWGLPMVIVVTALGLNVLGLDETYFYSDHSSPSVTAGWCFIRSTYDYTANVSPQPSKSGRAVPPKWFNGHWQEFWMMMAGGGWELLAYIICPVFYILTTRHIYLEVQNERNMNVFHTETCCCRLEARLTCLLMNLRLKLGPSVGS